MIAENTNKIVNRSTNIKQMLNKLLEIATELPEEFQCLERDANNFHSIDIGTETFCRQTAERIQEQRNKIGDDCKQTVTDLRFGRETVEQNTVDNHEIIDALDNEIQAEKLEISKQIGCMERNIMDKIGDQEQQWRAMVNEFDEINSAQNELLASGAGGVIKRITEEIERNDIDCICGVKAISGVRENTHNSYVKLSDTIEAINTDLDTYAVKALKTYTPTGQTPARKEFKYPLELAATSPHERIVRRFWQQNNDVSVSQLDCSSTITEVWRCALSDHRHINWACRKSFGSLLFVFFFFGREVKMKRHLWPTF